MAEISYLSPLSLGIHPSKPAGTAQKSMISNPLKQEIPIEQRKSGTDFANLEEKAKESMGNMITLKNPMNDQGPSYTYEVPLGMANGALLTRVVDASGNQVEGYPSKSIIERYEEQIRQTQTSEINRSKTGT